MNKALWTAAWAAMTVLATTLSAAAAIKTETVDYKHGDTQLQGYLAYDDAAKGPRPLVLVVHEWWGLNDYAKSRARQVAQLGYVAFAVDMYGKGVLAKDAGAQAGKLWGDLALLRGRIAAALDAVKSDKRVDPKRIAAIGYCFGGTTVLELARSGAAVAGVVSFHGNLDAPKDDDAKPIKAKVLVLTGADDKSVPPSAIAAFTDEMRKAKANYQVNIYGNAVHTFTNPAAGNDPSRNSAYNAQADKRSWQAMKDFLVEVFQE